MSEYKPLQIKLINVYGILESMTAMRLPKHQSMSDTVIPREIGPKDARLASALVRAGDSHAKAIRGVIAYIAVEMQIGWMIHLDTYHVGVQVLSTSSTMHNELRDLRGPELAAEKQRGLADKVYVRIFTANYQALRRMYRQRRGHRHPDWAIFCRFVEGLPHSETLIMPELFGNI